MSRQVDVPLVKRVDDDALRAIERAVASAYENCQGPTEHVLLHPCDPEQAIVTLYDLRQLVSDLRDLRTATAATPAGVSCTCAKGGGVLDMTKPGSHHDATCPMRFDPDEIPF